MIPSFGATQRLPRLVGHSKAKHILFTGRGINSFEAQRLGIIKIMMSNAFRLTQQIALITIFFPSGLLDTVEENSCPLRESVLLGREIAASAPLAVKAVKLAINLGAETDISTGLKIEEACYAGIRLSKDRQEGLQAFIEKRNPDFVGE
jgi:enoyl-CoA hydratase/carnithine racemase